MSDLSEARKEAQATANLIKKLVLDFNKKILISILNLKPNPNTAKTFTTTKKNSFQ